MTQRPPDPDTVISADPAAWDNLRRDVNARIDILERIASGQVENLPEHARQALLRAVVDPCLHKLAEFVIAIELDDETLANLADGRDPDAGMFDTDHAPEN